MLILINYSCKKVYSFGFLDRLKPSSIGWAVKWKCERSLFGAESFGQ
jgi:hypothetical protein